MKQQEALSILKSGSSAFVTGAPGSGKTYLINEFVAWARSKGLSVAVTASTGIAATHINGQTIHSWAGVGIAHAPTRRLLRNVVSRRGSRIRATDVLVIDEVSMLSASFIDLIDVVCRRVRKSKEPFGGLQVLLAGDLFQLPPVVRRGEPAPTDPDARAFLETYARDGLDANGFLTDSHVWLRLRPPVCYLTEQWRQSTGRLLTCLTHIRQGKVTAADEQALQDRIGVRPEPGQAAVRLFPTNRQADRINELALSQLPGQPHHFHASYAGGPILVERLKKSVLAPEHLVLKQGAVVMALRNDPSGLFINGSLGVVAGFSKKDGRPVVAFENGNTVTMSTADWDMTDGEEVLASCEQIPLRLAWAITIHKSQGMTLDAAQMDLTRTFTPGMGYVALSRVQDIDGLFLDGIGREAFEVSDLVKGLDAVLRARSRKVEEILAANGPEYFGLTGSLQGAIDFSALDENSLIDPDAEHLLHQSDHEASAAERLGGGPKGTGKRGSGHPGGSDGPAGPSDSGGSSGSGDPSTDSGSFPGAGDAF